MMKPMVASLLVGTLCTTAALGQRGVLDSAQNIKVMESPVRIDARPQATAFTTPLAVSRAALDELRNADFDAVSMVGFPLSDGELVDLDLRRMTVFADDAEFVNANGAPQSLAERGREGRTMLFGGEVAGSPGSGAFLAFTPTGTNGFIQIDGQTHMVSSGKHVEGAQPVIANLATLPADALEWKEFRCSTLDPTMFDDMIDQADQAGQGGEAAGVLGVPADVINAAIDRPTTRRGVVPMPGRDRADQRTMTFNGETEIDCRIVRVAIETDVEFGQEFVGGAEPQQALEDYVETLVGAVSFIYRENLNLEFRVVFLRNWIGQPTDADPWTGFSTSDVLFELREQWTPFVAPTQVVWQGVHLLSARNLGGGVAFVRGMCNLDIAHAVTADMSASFPLNSEGEPVSFQPQNYDVSVVAHEWGHNLGAPHTHGVRPAIDGCAFGDCFDAQGGTIMSYCHLCPGGFGNIDLNFNERIRQDFMLPFLQSGITCNLIQPAEACAGEPEPPVEECPADVNGDDALTGADFTAWIIAYNNGDLAADFTGDSQLTPADFNAWLIAFNQGCDFGDE